MIIRRIFTIFTSLCFLFSIFLSQISHFQSPAFAAAGIDEIINFQGKVVNSDGTNVADNVYSFEIKIYDGPQSGDSTLFTETWTTASLFSSTMASAPGAGGESLTYSSDTNESTIKVGQILTNVTKEEQVIVESVNTTSNVITISPTRQAWAGSDTVTNRIYVNDGVFRIRINSLNQDLSAVDFNSDELYVGVNFNADGEMKPRVQFTSVPYALNAKTVAGLTVQDENALADTTGVIKVPDGATLTFQGTDTYVGRATSDTLTNKTIGSTGLTFSGASPDITSASNEDLTITAGGTGDAVISTDADTQFRIVAAAAPGVDLVDITNTGQGTITSTVDGLSIDFYAATGGSGETNAGAHITITDSGDNNDTISGLQVTAGTASTTDENQYGIWVEQITGGNANEYALNIDSGWDRGLTIADAGTYSVLLESDDGDAASGMTFGTTSPVSVFRSANNELTIGSTTNGFTLDIAAATSATNALYNGVTQPLITQLISAEYPGATLTASNSATTTGNMTSDISRDADLWWMNYYDWTSTTVSPLQDYTVAVKVTLPSNFVSWQSSNALQINFATEWTDNTKNKLDVYIYNMTDTPAQIVTQSLTNVSAPAADWEVITIDDSVLVDATAPDWDAAGETAVFFLKLSSLRDASNCTAGSDNGCYVRVGDITLNYKAAF